MRRSPNIMHGLLLWLCLSLALPGLARAQPAPVRHTVGPLSGPSAVALTPITGQHPQRPPFAQPPAVASSSTEAYTASVYLPLTVRPFPVDLSSKQDSLRFYREQYLPAEGVSIAWTGNYSQCAPGTTDADFRSAVVRRVNYFRAMAGVPNDIVLTEEYNRKAQAAALMMSVNGTLSHYPTADWLCYSADGADGALHSNLALFSRGPLTIDAYIKDIGASNAAMGHRRWILYPSTREMGVAEVPEQNDYWGSNALWVVDTYYYYPRPHTRHVFVAWPPPGYVPYPVVYARWSLSYPNADFSEATVTMLHAGHAVSLVLEPVRNSPGDNTIVWVPFDMSSTQTWSRPQGDTAYTVMVGNVLVDGIAQDFNYDVVVFDPDP